MPSPRPFASIIMPTYNRADFLDECLPPLFAQTYPHDRYEIILVDDGSTDDTADRAAALAVGWDGRFRVVSKPNGGPASARNAGLKAAEGEILAFIDSGCVAGPDWLADVVGALLDLGADGVGAPIRGSDDPGWVARYLKAVEFYRHRARHGRVEYLVTTNAAFRRAVLEAVGGFRDEGRIWVEDVDLSYTLTDAGYKLAIIDYALIQHIDAPGSVGSFARKMFYYGRSVFLRLRRWRSKRNPWIDFIRHAGAVVLSPFLALSLRRKAGLWWALSFTPLIMIEHVAFMAGMANGALWGMPAET